MVSALLLSVFCYAAAGVFLCGLIWRVAAWWRVPVPLKVPLTPAPATRAGVPGRFAADVLLFRGMAKANPGLWVLAWGFHLCLLLLAAGHIVGLALPESVRVAVGLGAEAYSKIADPVGGVVGVLSFVVVLALIIRRVASPAVRTISRVEDYLAPALLLVVILTGNQLRFSEHFDIIAARQFLINLASFHPQANAVAAGFATHLLFVGAFAVLIPFSRLSHFTGVFINPVLVQANNPRRRRYAPLSKAEAVQ